MQNVELKAGRLVTFSEGEYSDYGYCGSYVALQDVSNEQMRELAGEARKEAARRDVDITNRSEGGFVDPATVFQELMIRKGWLAIIEMQEIHLGAYGSLDLS